MAEPALVKLMFCGSRSPGPGSEEPEPAMFTAMLLKSGTLNVRVLPSANSLVRVWALVMTSIFVIFLVPVRETK